MWHALLCILPLPSRARILILSNSKQWKLSTVIVTNLRWHSPFAIPYIIQRVGHSTPNVINTRVCELILKIEALLKNSILRDQGLLEFRRMLGH